MIPNIKFHNPSAAHMRRLLEVSGYTRRQFAEHLGVTARTMRNWETYGGFDYASQYLAESISRYGHRITLNDSIKDAQSKCGDAIKHFIQERLDATITVWNLDKPIKDYLV